MFRIFLLWIVGTSRLITLTDGTSETKTVEFLNEHMDEIMRQFPADVNCVNILNGDDDFYPDTFDPIIHSIHRSEKFTVKYDNLQNSVDFSIDESNLLLINDYGNLE